MCLQLLEMVQICQQYVWHLYSATEKKTSLSEKSVSKLWSIILGQQSAIERKVWSRPHTFASIDQETNLTAGVSKAIERSI